ncbi:hypothetical protein ACFQ60_01545 [Streptomyces zhihengii]
MPGILVLGRGIADAPVSGGPRIDLVGSALSAARPRAPRPLPPARRPVVTVPADGPDVPHPCPGRPWWRPPGGRRMTGCRVS